MTFLYELFGSVKETLYICPMSNELQKVEKPKNQFALQLKEQQDKLTFYKEFAESVKNSEAAKSFARTVDGKTVVDSQDIVAACIIADDLGISYAKALSLGKKLSNDGLLKTHSSCFRLFGLYLL